MILYSGSGIITDEQIETSPFQSHETNQINKREQGQDIQIQVANVCIGRPVVGDVYGKAQGVRIFFAYLAPLKEASQGTTQIQARIE